MQQREKHKQRETERDMYPSASFDERTSFDGAHSSALVRIPQEGLQEAPNDLLPPRAERAPRATTQA